MQSLNPCIHSHTPRLAVIDNRSLPVRQVAYWRRDTRLLPEARVTVRQHDAAGRAIAQRDPRLVTDALAPANLATIYSLSGKVLSTTSVDAGWRVSLLGEADQAVQDWDGRGSQRWMEYDEQLRAQAVFEQRADDPRVCTERYRYGGADPACASHNQCGKLIRHDDPAGTQLFAEYGVIGGVLQQTRQLLRDLASPDWPERETDRDALLEPDTEAMTRSSYNGLGEVMVQTDAKDNRQLFSQTIAGQLREVRLQVASETAPITLVSAIEYNAHGQTEREVAGNGVITTLDYAPEDGRLSRLLAKRGNTTLQDLRYEYDAAGNVLSIEDAAQPIRYFANQRIEPVSRYGYDSLYQLVEATGWEAGEANRGPRFSPFNDPAPRANYRQTYHYDAGGNFLELIHEGPQSHGHRLVAQVHSNRCLPVHDGVEPGDEDFHRGFDANGNLLSLQPGQALSWDLRNQLREVRPVARDARPDDVECYVYGADGMRVRKVSLTQTNALTLRAEVRYLPNLELRTHSGTGEVLQVISVQAGRSTIRVLHWEQAPSRATVSDQYRYSLNDHLGSCSLELDSAGEVISQEGYHPFGTTAWFAGGGEVEASYKTVRYSGKERDATGLYYYGLRYYVPWLQRWLNPDPAGDVDGPNFYRMVRNNPLSYIDEHGQVPKNLNTAQGIHDAYKDFYNSTDRVLPFQIMKEVTQDKLNFKAGKASANMLEKAKAKRFTLRHYSSHPGMKGAEPPFVSIESNFSLVSQNKMTLGGKTGNTSEKDWTKAGNSAFTFFLLAVDGEVSDRGFLKNKTHFAEYDVADDEAMHEALGPDFANIEFFASSDVLDPKHARLETVPAVKGKLADLKALLLASAAISPVQLGRMESRVLLGALDQAFAGSLEIKLPGSVNVKQWHEKMTT